jgi:hypothetical protein
MFKLKHLKITWIHAAAKSSSQRLSCNTAEAWDIFSCQGCVFVSFRLVGGKVSLFRYFVPWCCRTQCIIKDLMHLYSCDDTYMRTGGDKQLLEIVL